MLLGIYSRILFQEYFNQFFCIANLMEHFTLFFNDRQNCPLEKSSLQKRYSERMKILERLNKCTTQYESFDIPPSH